MGLIMGSLSDLRLHDMAGIRLTGPGSLRRHWWWRLLLWRERARQRRALHRLDGHLLRDIGRSREAALREAGKPFWRA
jgi:uncharacterized protein YjiS (DUF1127 family)